MSYQSMAWLLMSEEDYADYIEEMMTEKGTKDGTAKDIEEAQEGKK